MAEGFLEDQILSDLNGFINTQNILAIYWPQELAIFQPELSDSKKVEQALAIFSTLSPPT